MSRFVGLNWDRSTVTRIELGQRQVSAAELLALAVLYNRPVADLLPSEKCQLTTEVSATPEALRDVLTGRARRHGVQFGSQFWTAFDQTKSKLMEGARRTQARFPRVPGIVIIEAAKHANDDAVVKAARKLGVDPLDVAVASMSKFERSLTDERDSRVGAQRGESMRARQARRGHVTRQLLDEIRPALDEILAARQEQEED